MSDLALLLGRLALQLAIILAAARLFGRLARRAGQPAGLGEIVADISLAPSVLGMLVPGAPAFLFPESSVPPLRLLGQLGVLLFLFSIGQHLRVDHLRLQARTAFLVSHAGLLVPFLLGIAMAFPLHERFAPPDAAFRAFALFMGVALSITAFPVLARIVEEQGLLGTPLGTTALACAAVADVTAWVLLAGVVALVTSGGAAFLLVVLLVVRPLLARRGRGEGVVETVLSLFVLAAAAWATERAGLHALFGAFVAGAVMPREAPGPARRRDASSSGAG